MPNEKGPEGSLLPALFDRFDVPLVTNTGRYAEHARIVDESGIVVEVDPALHIVGIGDVAHEGC